MATFNLSLEVSSDLTTGAAPLLEILVDGSVVSSASITAQTGVGLDLLSFTISFDDSLLSYPSSLQFRFEGSSGDGNETVTIHSARINGQSISNDLTATMLSQSQAAAVSTPSNLAFLFGRQEPTSGDLGATTQSGDGSVNPLVGQSGQDVIEGSANDDRIEARQDDDSIIGGDGNDALFGQDGNDMILGGNGNDRLYGNDGDDLLFGQGDNDTLLGHGGNDVLNGGTGNDILNAGAGDDIMYGEGGDDRLMGVSGNNTMYGDAGNDMMIGGRDNDVMYGGDDDDIMHGGKGDDIAYGEDGDDLLTGADGADTLDGGEGNDTIRGGDGNDIIDGGNGGDTLYGEGGDDQIGGGGNSDLIYGGDGNDNINGGANSDEIYGEDGDDTIDGGSGGDDIYGGEGDDTIGGGSGDDLLVGDNGDDNITGGQGNDTIYAGGTFITPLATQIANIIAANPGVTYYDADTGDSVLGSFYYYETTNLTWDAARTNAQSFSINGIAGRLATVNSVEENSYIASVNTGDTWVGGSDATIEGEWRWIDGPDDGQMFWLGGSGGSAQGGYYENWNGGEPNDWGSGEDALEINNGGGWNDQGAGTAQDSMIEWDGADLLTLPDSDDGTTNTLDGGDGDDTIYGANGIDTIFGGDGIDTVDGGENDDIISGDDGNDILEGGEGDNVINGGNGNDTITAGSGNDTMNGDADNDTISGGTGNDTINGGDGDDILNGDYAVGFIVTQQGWSYEYYDLASQPNNLASAGFTINGGRDNSNTASSTGVTQTFDPSDFDTGDDFALKFETVLTINTAGTYTFRTRSDDGSQLFLDGTMIVDNDGLHGATTVTSAGQVLAAGTYILEGTFFERGGGQVMEIDMNGPDTGNNWIDLSAYSDVAVPSVTGSLGDDIINGNDGNDIIFGSSGDDTMDGGTGTDTLTYAGDEAAVTVDMDAGTATDGNGDTDTISNFEILIGSDYDDNLTGSGNDDTLNGGDGDDILTGGGGDDTIDGGSGTNIAIFSGNFSDYNITLNGSIYTLQDTRGSTPDGTDDVTNVQTYRFADGDVAEADMISTTTELNGTAGNDTLISLSVPAGSNPFIQAILDNNTRPITGGNGTQDLLYNSDTGNFYQFVRNFVNEATMNTQIAGGTIDGVAGSLVTFETTAERDWVIANMGADYGSGPTYQTSIVSDVNLGDSSLSTLLSNGTYGTTNGWTPYIVEWDGDAILGVNNNPGSGEPYILNGGDGDDLLYGADGSDMFVFENAFRDHVDQIFNFDKDDPDMIDISDILSGQGITVNAGNIAQYVMVNQYNGVRVDPTGSGQFYASGDNLLATFSGTTDVNDAATMLANGTLIV